MAIDRAGILLEGAKKEIRKDIVTEELGRIKTIVEGINKDLRQANPSNYNNERDRERARQRNLILRHKLAIYRDIQKYLLRAK